MSHAAPDYAPPDSALIAASAGFVWWISTLKPASIF
jgi:hypothetical protein